MALDCGSRGKFWSGWMVEARENCPLSRLSGQEGLLHSFGEDCKFAHVISGACLRRARLVRFGLPRGLPQDSFGTTSWRVMSLVQLVIALAMTGSTDPPSATNRDRLASGRWGDFDGVGDGRRRRTACRRMGERLIPTGQWTTTLFQQRPCISDLLRHLNF
ncbi:hypothetical protein F5144DRAFT_8111 [Chaetomium tenue]|uniref:Uncharacterized protein n=1 Tax=Chaetomium tenue TaxID=1854479 RepID=A0ACB7PMI3_9PEZI|nr:hypothetical protein F5144DRAFT_8111 [Chaetomium globosum]